MLRHKYKFSKNHGLLQPKYNQKHSPSLITSIALVTRNDSQNYHVHRNPNNQNIIMLFNNKQYLHRECTAAIDTAQQNVLEELSKKLKLGQNSLTIYVTNNHDLSTANIIGDSNIKDALIWRCFQKIKERKSENSYLSLSIVGIQNQNDLTDLLAVQMESDQPTSSISTSYFQRRKLRINKSEGKWEPTNAQIELLQTQKDLSEALQRYKQIKNAIQYTAFMSSPKWDWLQGELYILSQIQIDEHSQTILRNLKTHYILRINQYLRSVSSIMLKLGIQIRKMQDNLSKSVTQNNESKAFRLINHCFCKNNDGLSYKYHTNLILEIGHYDTLKEEYQNLVPTSQLLSQKAGLRQDKIQNASFLYLKHYEEYPSLVTLLGKVANNIVEKELNTVIEHKDSKKMQNSLRAKAKSYVYDTYSSIQKKNVRKQWTIEDLKKSDPQLIDVEEFIRKTAKLYKNEDEKQEGNQFKRINRSSIKHYEKKSQKKSSSLDWNANRQNYNQTPKVYISRNQANKTNKIQHQDMRSIQYLIDNKFQRSKQRNSSNLQNVYGTHIRKNRALHKSWKPRTDLSTISQRKGRKQKDSRDDLTHNQIIEPKKQDNFINQNGSRINQILQ